MAKKQISKSGAAKLREELDYLVTVRRAEMAQKLKEARAQGDLSENAEYDEAKNEQSFVEGRIKELEEQIRNVRVADDVQTDEIGIGSYMTVETGGRQMTYQLVGSAEADIKAGKLSNASPVGEGLMGHKVGDTVVIEVPRGTVTYTILDIHR